MKNKRKESIIKTITSKWWLMDNNNSLSYKIVKNTIETFSKLPYPIKKPLFSFIQSSIIWSTRLFFVMSHISLRGHLISGIEKNSGKNLKILFVGAKDPSHFILDLIYSGRVENLKEFKINFFNQKNVIESVKAETDAIIIKCDRFYSGFLEKKGYTVIPEWMRMTLDISKPLEDFYSGLSRSAKEDMRKIKHAGYTYEISQDIDKLKLFYYKMYVPFVSWRYKDTDILSNFYIMKILFEQGNKILFIKYKDDYIFGGLFLKKKDMVTATYAGVKEGEFDHLKKGVIAASYYYLINYSKEKGANVIDLGSCRAFVNDGLFLYKLKWGAKLGKSGDESSEIYAFIKCKESEAFQSFLDNNPFIYLKNGKLIMDAIKKKNN